CLLRHPGLDPGSRSAPWKSGTPDQVRGDEEKERAHRDRTTSSNAAKLACIAGCALLSARSYPVPDPFRPYMMCGRGGTGRRATLRSLWPKGRGSSSLLDRTRQKIIVLNQVFR